MKQMNVYLERYAHPYQLIHSKPDSQLGIVVVIPCYNEPELVLSLASLASCVDHSCAVEVIIIINQASDCAEEINRQNQETFTNATAWIKNQTQPLIRFQVHWIKDLPSKHAGVGLARKIGMDESVRRFEQIDSKDGIIACFDADSLCNSNYLCALENHFNKYPATPGCSIYYEHPLEGNLDDWQYDAITEYELFLRYYTHALRFAGHRHAFQTVGSSMAVRSTIYQKQGGMNRRKAGEDFYFLQKVIVLGSFTELTTTTVIPSARESDRVPFGTGKAVHDWKDLRTLKTYHPKTFLDMKQFLEVSESLYKSDENAINSLLQKLPDSILAFLRNNDFQKALHEMQTKTSSLPAFTKRFYAWFDAFRALKFVHFARDNFHGVIPVGEAASQLLDLAYQRHVDSNKASELLKVFRGMDRE